MSEARDFWSRRKAQVVKEAEAEEAVLEARALEAEQAEKSDDEILAELGLPAPEAMAPGDDFSGFMAKAVPDRLRRRALRRLWLTNPVLANVDGLVDYGEDFTDGACVIENLQTAYQVGKGMTKHVEEMARQAEAEEAPVEEETPEEAVELAEAEPESNAKAEPVAYAPVEAAPELEPEPEEAPAPRRRMRFDFEESGVRGA